MGTVTSVMQFGEVIARKSLHASGFALTLLEMSMPIAALTSLWWALIIEGREQRRLLIIIGSFSFIALATGAMLYTMNHMLIIHFIFFLTFALFGPSENRILQQHVASSQTGRTFGKALSIRMGVAALVTGVAGIWMEHIEGGYRNIYPIAALFGFIGLGFLASIRTGGNHSSEPISINRHFIISPIIDVIRLLKRRKDYLRFEIAFMLYGAAFMMTLPVVPLFLVDDLELGYHTIGLARGTVSQLVMIGMVPIFGRIFDKSTPHRLAVVIFTLLSLFPLLLLSAKFVDGNMKEMAVYVAFGYFGIVMSGVIVLWQLSSIRFSGGEDAGVYHSVHVTATGIRGLFAPFLGLFIMTAMGKTAALLIASGLFLISSFLMIIMRRIDYKRGENRSLRAHL